MNKKNFSPKKYPTKFDGYYVSEDGKVWTEFNRYSGKKEPPREINQFLRGGATSNHRYMAVNISIKDKNGKTIKQIRYYTHRLIAETLVKNPNNYLEIDHIDRDKKNNCVDNLRWVSRCENMEYLSKSYTITDTVTGKIWKGENTVQWAEENYDLINSRTKTKNRTSKEYAKNLCNARRTKTKIWKLTVEF